MRVFVCVFMRERERARESERERERERKRERESFSLSLFLDVGVSRGSYADFGTELVSDPYQFTKLATIFRNQFFSNNLVWNW